MENRKRYEKCKAFTLVEILIVVIIIGILAGLMALIFGSSTETAERTACRGDRRTIKSAYYVERAESGKTFKDSLEEAMERFTKVKNLNVTGDTAVCTGVCHAGGIYTITTTSDDKLLISCSIEGHDEEKMDRTKTIYGQVVDAHTGMSGWPSGNALMELVKELLDGDYIYDGKEYYTKVDVKGKNPPLLYASEQKYTNGTNRFKADYVYNSETDKWYKCYPSISTSSMLGDIRQQIYDSINKGSEIIYYKDNKESERKDITWTEVSDFVPFLK
ncbi:MAG: prepilin-type N-terminal cleavage/methylation domain-containing protein [Cloacibacillus porcorum]|uniref:prepilin-type N-terminal cleavage/methylation domain-containing protein n=1 Tax=Cloacibacillus porcorum TaxID=1197717 RepID=UPI0023F29784|nr:prepilin-type N-terminal cleavage/methylation domain-containing protein [Cloacibacillus porcorum]MCD7876684.1 prepilin-type N-terminal cleavage/methylation domain-containing protein [Cloacibacillus porcorum]